MATRFLVVPSLLLLLVSSVPGVREARGEPPPGSGPSFSLSPHRLDRCRAFLVLDAGGSIVSMSTHDAMDRFIVADGVGLMVNVDSSWAVGGVLELTWARGVVKPALVLRCRRWFGREQSLEASAGYLGPAGRDAKSQLVGPLAYVRYSPVPVVFVQGGLCRYAPGAWYDVDFAASRGREVTRFFGGVGMTGAGAAGLLGVEALALGVLVVLFAGMAD